MTTELLHVYKGIIIENNVGLSSSGAGFYLEQDVSFSVCFFFSPTEAI